MAHNEPLIDPVDERRVFEAGDTSVVVERLSLPVGVRTERIYLSIDRFAALSRGLGLQALYLASESDSLSQQRILNIGNDLSYDSALSIYHKEPLYTYDAHKTEQGTAGQITLKTQEMMRYMEKVAPSIGLTTLSDVAWAIALNETVAGAAKSAVRRTYRYRPLERRRHAGLGQPRPEYVGNWGDELDDIKELVTRALAFEKRLAEEGGDDASCEKD